MSSCRGSTEPAIVWLPPLAMGLRKIYRQSGQRSSHRGPTDKPRGRSPSSSWENAKCTDVESLIFFKPACLARLRELHQVCVRANMCQTTPHASPSPRDCGTDRKTRSAVAFLKAALACCASLAERAMNGPCYASKHLRAPVANTVSGTSAPRPLRQRDAKRSASFRPR